MARTLSENPYYKALLDPKYADEGEQGISKIEALISSILIFNGFLTLNCEMKPEKSYLGIVKKNKELMGTYAQFKPSVINIGDLYMQQRGDTPKVSQDEINSAVSKLSI